MRNHKAIAMIIFVVGLSLNNWLIAQEEDKALPDMLECTPETLQEQQQALFAMLPLDFENEYSASQANLFQLGQGLSALALNCGYQPTETELQILIDQTLSVAKMADIIAANAVGTDVEAILVELEDISGDSFNGQLLYNGLELALDGTALGCAGCHTTSEVAPSTAGTWTRVSEIRLNDPALAGQSVREYLVRSIVDPNAYIAPNFAANLMATNFGARLDLQQLADIVAFMESQDQLLED